MADPMTSAALSVEERDRLAARAAHYADDARNIVARVTLYEEVHPDDAPCLESLLRAIPGITWRGHDA